MNKYRSKKKIMHEYMKVYIILIYIKQLHKLSPYKVAHRIILIIIIINFFSCFYLKRDSEHVRLPELPSYRAKEA